MTISRISRVFSPLCATHAATGNTERRETRPHRDIAGLRLPAAPLAAWLLLAGACTVGTTAAGAAVDDATPVATYARTMLGDDWQEQLPRGAAASDSTASISDNFQRLVEQQLGYEVTVRRGSFGIPHIRAEDFGSLGYGEAYAAAEDHVCNIAYGLLQARGEMARYLGPGPGGGYVAFDGLVRAMDFSAQAEAAFARQIPEVKEWLIGYTAGYNRYLREHPGGRNDSWCSGARWLKAATPLDFAARLALVAQTLPQMTAAIASTQPPGSDTAAANAASDEELKLALDASRLPRHGSNGWALGREMTENGRGLLLANPHYPWYGGRRFWEKHLTIPGRLDVYGAGLIGAPGVSIGFNRAVGWTHTVSASQRIVLYRLTLHPEDPMRYRYDDDSGEGWRSIERRVVQVPVAGGNGELQSVERAVYFSHYGPLLTLPGATWDKKYAYAARDANAGNDMLIAQWLAMGSAESTDEFIDAHRRFNAMPWVNTIAAGADGRAVYLDNSTTGYLRPEAEEHWRASLAKDPLAAGLYAQRGLVLLDGSDPGNEWIETEDATIPGTTPFHRRPLIERDDYVFNANDSYWLTSPREPTTGYSVLYGPVDTARSLRTRMNVRMLENGYGDAGADGRFSREEVQRSLFANRGLAAELLIDELIGECRQAAKADRELVEACDVLARYDGTLNLDSPGAVLFREWVTRYDYAETKAQGALFAAAFDAERPVMTPASLGDGSRAIEELRGAIAVLNAADLPLAATLRDTQFAYRAGDAIAVHGGNSHEGVANLQIADDPSASPIAGIQPNPVADSPRLTDAGYPIVHGSSFILTLAFTDDGPVGEALLSYSQSGNPNSPHFTDQTRLYRDKSWREVVFEEKDVIADTQSIRVLRSADVQSR